MENFNVTENTNKMYGKEAPSVFSEAFSDMQGKGNNLYAEKDNFKKPLPQGFPELTIQEQLGDAGSLKDFTGKKKMIDAELGNKKPDFGDKKEGIERLNKKEDELVRQKKESSLDNGLKFDKGKIPNSDGGTKDSVNQQNSSKPAGLDGGPKDKPAALGQAANDSASERSLESTHAPDKVVNLDGGQKGKYFPEKSQTTPAPDKIVNLDGGEKYPAP